MEMTHFEMVEKLREKANVSYEEAKAALEKADWDLLDAMLILEKQGRIGGNGDKGSSGAGEYTTKREKKTERAEKDRHTFGEKLGKFGRWLARMVAIGNANILEVYRNGEKLMAISVTTFAVLLLFIFPLPLILMVVGLFFGFKYKFQGPNFGRDAINSAIDRAANMADGAKREFREKRDKHNKGESAYSNNDIDQSINEAEDMAEELKRDV
jgi:Sec-independent protein translocase protein TatA